MTNDNWETPIELFKQIEDSMGIFFNLDPCTTEDNPLGTIYYFTPEHDGLTQSWDTGEPTYAFMNPPYSREEIPKWVEKARTEVDYYDNDIMVVGLLPLRTAKWFKRSILPNAKIIRHLNHWKYEEPDQCLIYFLPKRIKFIDPETGIQEKNSPSWDSFLAIWI